MILAKQHLDTALESISNLIDTLSNFKDGSFNENAHKAFSLLCEFYLEYEQIYTKNMEILDNALTPQIKLDLEPIQTKIKAFIDKVNSNPNNMKLPSQITYHEKETK
ncbi:biotin--acetyl-CoA-carboxylase ligase (plasmid) [Borrelia coriaceae]|uniref:BlyB family putative holin accessory protein n=1 Tax=Borrelia coriaceae TaxID=144 RepID=UPI001FF6CE09|nr:BlyB family putative holin accessory protein [Borrelia coriaceae]UPA16784.1 biotin--acetyl-CoA-carboxylase ligase [Borrelia coriaceae]